MADSTTLTEKQALNLSLGQCGYDIILPTQTWTGSWHAVRVQSCNGLILNNISHSVLSTTGSWATPDYLYNDFYKIVNGTSFPLIAYRSGLSFTPYKVS